MHFLPCRIRNAQWTFENCVFHRSEIAEVRKYFPHLYLIFGWNLRLAILEKNENVAFKYDSTCVFRHQVLFIDAGTCAHSSYQGLTSYFAFLETTPPQSLSSFGQECEKMTKNRRFFSFFARDVFKGWVWRRWNFHDFFAKIWSRSCSLCSKHVFCWIFVIDHGKSGKLLFVFLSVAKQPDFLFQLHNVFLQSCRFLPSGILSHSLFKQCKNVFEDTVIWGNTRVTH